MSKYGDIDAERASYRNRIAELKACLASASAEYAKRIAELEEMFGVQWGGLVECAERELTPGAIKVRRRLLAMESERISNLKAMLNASEAQVKALRADNTALARAVDRLQAKLLKEIERG